MIQEEAALHFTISALGQPSISTQVAALRRILLHKQEGDLGHWIKQVHHVCIRLYHIEFQTDYNGFLLWLQGKAPLVITAHSADVIATLLSLKKEIESKTVRSIKLTIFGGSEAHLLAKELSDARVGVILNPVRSFPYDWEGRRMSATVTLSSSRFQS